VRSFTGVAQARQEAELSFKVGGTVQRVAVEVGDEVASEDVIAELDPRDYRLQAEETEASLRSQEAQRRNAQVTYDRTEQLYENNNASLSDLDAARAALETTTATVRQMKTALEMARTQLGYTVLRAPAAGCIAEVDLEVDENVQAGHRVVRLTVGSELEVMVSMPEVLIVQVRQGDVVSVQFDAQPDQTFAALVTEVGVTAAGAASTYPVTVRLTDQNDNLRAGMAAEVAFTFGSQDGHERILVSPSAVGEDSHGRFVFVVTEVTGVGDQQGVASRRPVDVGELTGEGLEITSGLVDGDLLVTAGVHKLVDGTRVKLLSEAGGGR